MVILVGLIYVLFRNLRVLKFRLWINQLQYDWSVRHVKDNDYESAYKWFNFSQISYNKMVFSFKPLKLEKWYKKELIDKLLN